MSIIVGLLSSIISTGLLFTYVLFAYKTEQGERLYDYIKNKD